MGKLLESSLSKNLISVFLRVEDFEGKTFSYTVRRLSGDYSESSVKYILRRLREMELIDCGNSEERGKPLRFTDFGRKIKEVL